MSNEMDKIFGFADNPDGPPLIKVCVIAKFQNDMTLILKIKVPEEFYEQIIESNKEDPIHAFDFSFGPLRLMASYNSIESFEILKEN